MLPQKHGELQATSATCTESLVFDQIYTVWEKVENIRRNSLPLNFLESSETLRISMYLDLLEVFWKNKKNIPQTLV